MYRHDVQRDEVSTVLSSHEIKIRVNEKKDYTDPFCSASFTKPFLLFIRMR